MSTKDNMTGLVESRENEKKTNQGYIWVMKNQGSIWIQEENLIFRHNIIICQYVYY